MTIIENGAEALIKLCVNNQTLDKSERAALIEFDEAFDFVNDDCDMRVVAAYLESGLAQQAMDYWNEKRRAYQVKLTADAEALEESMHWDRITDEARGA